VCQSNGLIYSVAGADWDIQLELLLDPNLNTQVELVPEIVSRQSKRNEE
jgi:hypothetical protein